jgi:UDP-2,3-diacylglucosamine pyrophosphatase LpxH
VAVFQKVYQTPIPDFVVVSDTHFGDTKHPIYQIVLPAFIEQMLVLKPHTIVFLGDIFDFIAGNMPYFIDKYTHFFKGIQTLEQAGVRCIFVEGNHDFACKYLPYFSHIFTDKIELTLQDGASWYLEHGDLWRAPWHYYIYRSIVKSWFFIGLTTRVFTGKFIDTVCLWLAKHSRHYSSQKSITNTLNTNTNVYQDARWNTKLANKFITYWGGKHNYILGHFHMDLLECTHNKHLCIGPSWIDAPSYLWVVSDKKPERIWFINNIQL